MTYLFCTSVALVLTSQFVLRLQKKEIAYIEKVLGLEIHHKLDINQFRNKMYERPNAQQPLLRMSFGFLRGRIPKRAASCGIVTSSLQNKLLRIK